MLSVNVPIIKNEKSAQRGSFWDGHPLGRTSRGHPGVIRADIPAQNFGQGGQNPGKNKHFGTDIHDPKARTSTTLREFQKLRSEKLWAEFLFPKLRSNCLGSHFPIARTYICYTKEVFPNYLLEAPCSYSL